ncbi:MAG TPA: tRNA adenosine deaminase-associated protein [Candidatus Nanopelagicales bacterium]
MDDAAVDFAVAAWREDGLWQVVLLPPGTGETLEGLVDALRAQPGEGGVLGLVSVAEEFFLLVRVLGEEVRLLLSDVYAAEEWPLGLDALDRLGVPSPEDDESEEPQPAGDLRVVDDFGVGPVEIELLLDDDEMWPDEQLATIATRIGFGEQFDAALEQLPD